ncbi:MAG: molybdopterin-guanine dinucleotide biosynthesis protein B [Planctomycetes bacterium]|nr:molybdopterin-guanine dinucleotide biosynthesis protein B [Planctomycetota bacterium]
MPPHIVSVVGAQNSGKTRLVMRLVRHFTGMGLRVGTIKHASHGFDVPGKDSHVHFTAGAIATALVGPDRLALFRRQREPTLKRLVRTHFRDVDLVIVEGFRRWRVPRIEVYRRAVSPRPLGMPVDAFVSDDMPDTKVPTYATRDIARLARFILRLGPRGASRSRARSSHRRAGSADTA